MGEVEKKETVPEASEDGVLKVISAKTTGNELRVIIEGSDLARLSSPEARKLAFVQRLKVGMGNAGVEAVGGTFVPAEEYEDAKDEQRNVKRWHREFRLVNMI